MSDHLTTLTPAQREAVRALIADALRVYDGTVSRHEVERVQGLIVPLPKPERRVDLASSRHGSYVTHDKSARSWTLHRVKYHEPSFYFSLSSLVCAHPNFTISDDELLKCLKLREDDQ